jgi:hypothetical protein
MHKFSIFRVNPVYSIIQITLDCILIKYIIIIILIIAMYYWYNLLFHKIINFII